MRPEPAALAAAGALLMAATLVTFFVFIFPAHQVTEHWTMLPARWEYVHAINAGLTFLALAVLVLSALTWRG